MDQKFARTILEQVHRDYNIIAEEFSATRFAPWDELRPFTSLVSSGDQVLDMGCGNGRLYELLKDRNVSYTGIDVSEELINIARKKWQGAKAQFFVQDILEFPQEGQEGSTLNEGRTLQEKFDIIFAIAILHHIPSFELRVKALNNMHAALKPGGTLVLTVWNLWPPQFWPVHIKQAFRGLFRGRTSKMFRGSTSKSLDLDFGDLFIPWKGSTLPQGRTLKRGPVLRYYHAFTLPGLCRLLQKSGFKIREKYYAKKGERSNFLKGYNLVVIARK